MTVVQFKKYFYDISIYFVRLSVSRSPSQSSLYCCCVKLVGIFQ